MRRINEGAFKSLATAGMLGLGALGGAQAFNTNQNASQPVRSIPTVSDETILVKTLPLTKWAEGYRDMMYKDSKGIPTIGYGSNLNAAHIRKELESLGYSPTSLLARNQAIREKDAEILLKRGMAQALKDAKKFASNWDQLDPIAKVVLVDMSYNLGLTRLSKFKRFRSALERLDYAEARDEMIDSKWYNDVGRRSKRLVQLMDTLASRS